MKDSISRPPADDAGLVELGVALGQNRSFGLLAGRCSAAQAAAIRQLREEKKYQRLEPQWQEFCPKYLNMSRSQADKLIGLLEEFGPTYFEMAQLTRISPETYRAIAPALKNGALQMNGEVIDLTPDNARKVADAVKELRSAAPAEKKQPAPTAMPERISRLEAQCGTTIEEFRAIAQEQRAEEEDARTRLQFIAVLRKMRSNILSVGLENGVFE